MQRSAPQFGHSAAISTSVWSAPTTSDRDRKELLRALLEEVIIALQRHEYRAQLTMRWRGGAITQLDLPIPRFQPMGPRPTKIPFRYCAAWPRFIPTKRSPAFSIAGRKTATGERFTANQVGSLRRYRKIPRFQPLAEPAPGALVDHSQGRADARPRHFDIHRWLDGWFYRRRTNHARRSMADSHYG